MHTQKLFIEKFLLNSLGICECADQALSPWVIKMPEKLFLESSKNNNLFL